MRRFLAAALALPTLAGLFGVPLTALGNNGLSLEEIIVTATQRETNLHDTAMAISAYTGDRMEELNINNPLIYEALVPSLSYQVSPNRVSIRGVGRFSNALGTNPGVAIYTDGIYSAEAASMFSQPANTERTEVLRGPQGTLWGRNTTGGAVSVTTRRPTEDLSGDFRVKYGETDYRQYQGRVSGPITDDLRFKVYALDTEQDGLQDNIAGDDIRTTNSFYYEGQLEWHATENLRVWFKYNHLDQDYIPGASVQEDAYDCVNEWAGLGPAAMPLECAEGRFAPPSVDDPWKVARNTPGNIELDLDTYTAHLDYAMDSAVVSYLWGYIDYTWDQKNVDFDSTPNELSTVNDIGQYQEQQSHELRIASNWDKKWQYIAGLYYYEDENDQPFAVRTVPVGDSPGNTSLEMVTANFVDFWENPDQIYYFQRGRIDNESWALFGEVDMELAEKWTLTLGLRYSEDDYFGEETQLQYYDLRREGFDFAFDASQDDFAGDPTRYTDTFDASYNDSYENTTGRAIVSYRPQQGHLFWGTLANGYKMGGIRLGSLEKFYSEAAGVPSDGTYDQEELVMLELGWKAEFLDKRLQTELIAFGYDYTDMQRQRSRPGPPPGEINITEVINIDAEIYGLEFSGTWLLTDELRAMITSSYNHSEITSDTFFRSTAWGERDADNEVIPENVQGNHLTLTPEWKAAFTVHYAQPTDVGTFSLGGTYAYVDERYFDLTNYNMEDSYTRLDIQAYWQSTNDRWKILLTVNNATDQEFYNTYSCSVNSDAVAGTDSFIRRCGGRLNDERFTAVELSYRFR
ncbi:MAG: TonB-dependent receptor [Halioglobus sp.]|nr:TonB-dependent receptor [Halioglobus sp.]